MTKHANASDEQVIETMLTAEGNQTILAWEERGIPADLVAAYGAGVQVHVEDLAADLAGDECCDAAARFNELFPTNRELAAKVS